MWPTLLLVALVGPPCYGSVRGDVFDSTTGRAYGAMSVRIDDLDLKRKERFFDSKFEFDSVPCGEHQIIVQVIEGLNATIHTVRVPIVVRPGEEAALRVPVLLASTKPATSVELVVGRDAPPGATFDVRIRTEPSRLRVGDRPVVRVRIRNRTNRATWLVRALDGSTWGRFPQIGMQITGPEGGFAVPGYGLCGNRSGMGARDIVRIGPGKEFDPFAGGWFPYDIQSGTFRRPGRYRLTFTYSSMERDSRRWSASPNLPMGDEISNLLALVSRVELRDSLEFVVDP